MPPKHLSLLASASTILSLSTAQSFGNNAGISNVSTSACPQTGGAHIIVARASVEQPGYGVIGAVKDVVLSAIPGSTAEAVVYPATLNAYFQSESDGVTAMRQLIAHFVGNCADAPLVLMGYSQGAQVTADALVGQVVGGFPDNSSIDQPRADRTLERVAAVVLMGDPSSNLTETFHVGNSTKNGIFPRRNVADFGATGLARRIRSYCDAGDPYCASGDFSMLAVHLGYVGEYGMQAAEFVEGQVKAYYANSTTSGGASSGNGTSSTGSASGTATGSGAPASYTGGASSLSSYAIASTISLAVLGAVFAWLL